MSAIVLLRFECTDYAGTSRTVFMRTSARKCESFSVVVVAE